MSHESYMDNTIQNEVNEFISSESNKHFKVNNGLVCLPIDTFVFTIITSRRGATEKQYHEMVNKLKEFANEYNAIVVTGVQGSTSHDKDVKSDPAKVTTTLCNVKSEREAIEDRLTKHHLQGQSKFLTTMESIKLVNRLIDKIEVAEVAIAVIEDSYNDKDKSNKKKQG